MGRENYIVTGVDSFYNTRKRKGYFSSHNLLESSPQSVYVYGIVTYVDSNSKRIGYDLLDDSISVNKQGTALPLYFNNTVIPGIGDTVPLVKAPTPDSSFIGGQYEKIFYYLDPTNKSSSPPPPPPTGGGGGGGSSRGILKNANPNLKVIPTNADDIDFYHQILNGIGAPITDENMTFFYAWHQAEYGYGCNAAWNPFNTTYNHGEFITTNFNSAKVKNYASKADGISATVKTLKLSYYTDIKDGLVNNIGAGNLSKCASLDTWGTKTLINDILAGNSLNASKKPIQRNTCQVN